MTKSTHYGHYRGVEITNAYDAHKSGYCEKIIDDDENLGYYRVQNPSHFTRAKNCSHL